MKPPTPAVDAALAQRARLEQGRQLPHETSHVRVKAGSRPVHRRIVKAEPADFAELAEVGVDLSPGVALKHEPQADVRVAVYSPGLRDAGKARLAAELLVERRADSQFLERFPLHAPPRILPVIHVAAREQPELTLPVVHEHDHSRRVVDQGRVDHQVTPGIRRIPPRPEQRGAGRYPGQDVRLIGGLPGIERAHGRDAVANYQARIISRQGQKPPSRSCRCRSGLTSLLTGRDNAPRAELARNEFDSLGSGQSRRHAAQRGAAVVQHVKEGAANWLLKVEYGSLISRRLQPLHKALLAQENQIIDMSPRVGKRRHGIQYQPLLMASGMTEDMAAICDRVQNRLVSNENGMVSRGTDLRRDVRGKKIHLAHEVESGQQAGHHLLNKRARASGLIRICRVNAPLPQMRYQRVRQSGLAACLGPFNRDNRASAQSHAVSPPSLPQTKGTSDTLPFGQQRADSVSQEGHGVSHPTYNHLIVSAAVIADGRVLLVRQPGPEGPGTVWALPGGRVDQGELALEAVRREVAEETGLSLSPGRLVAISQLVNPTNLPPRDAGDIPRPGESATVLAYAFESQETDATGDGDPDGEIAEVVWYPLDQAMDLLEKIPFEFMRETCKATVEAASDPVSIVDVRYYRKDDTGNDVRVV